MNKTDHRPLAVVLIAAAAVSTAHAKIQERPSMEAQDVAEETGSKDFNFEFGSWRVRHRVKNLATGEWHTFEGTSTCRPLMGGSGNIEEHTFFRSSEKTYGVALRTYDKKTGEWAIWWIDSRYPQLPLDPPVKGRFRNGVGTFYSDSIINGKPTRTRFIWSQITPVSARWEQAFSTDSGKVWDTNWIMDFQRD